MGQRRGSEISGAGWLGAGRWARPAVPLVDRATSLDSRCSSLLVASSFTLFVHSCCCRDEPALVTGRLGEQDAARNRPGRPSSPCGDSCGCQPCRSQRSSLHSTASLDHSARHDCCELVLRTAHSHTRHVPSRSPLGSKRIGRNGRQPFSFAICCTALTMAGAKRNGNSGERRVDPIRSMSMRCIGRLHQTVQRPADRTSDPARSRTRRAEQRAAQQQTPMLMFRAVRCCPLAQFCDASQLSAYP